MTFRPAGLAGGLGTRRPAVLAAALAFIGITVSGAAALHLRMTDSLPKQDQTVTESPGEIRVWFNQKTSLAVSRLGLDGPGGKVEMGKVEPTDNPRSFKARVSDALSPGVYTVSWRTAGDDGHVIRGRYSFTMAETSPLADSGRP